MRNAAILPGAAILRDAPLRAASPAARRTRMARMTTLFISDLHLDAERPAITELFGRFIDDEARGADALYILGDLFEAWVGDDDPSEAGAFVADELRGAARRRRAGVFHPRQPRLPARRRLRAARRHDDPARPGGGLLHGKPTLLMHGDLLCTDDVAYQAVPRADARSGSGRRSSWRSRCRRASRSRSRRARRARRTSPGCSTQGTMEAITDVAPATVDATLRALRHRHADPRPHASARRCTTHRRRRRASCSATGTSRARCCAWMRDGAKLSSL